MQVLIINHSNQKFNQTKSRLTPEYPRQKWIKLCDPLLKPILIKGACQLATSKMILPSRITHRTRDHYQN
ncbi:UNKNOWN [Stylonychia lemnae]|uniref:Uncharacterized protein n=1 Tax=Stylonychia lemnae TaxID=5949 RepID=A0A078B8K8_STYLE|nr:UNKNOWN [Stylonychia lemnae]|eukprot:CDW90536.1 UNKNOWN [Stylonychia lemnae]